MTNKDTQIFQFNQSERNTFIETPDGERGKWWYLFLLIDRATNEMDGDFEVIIRRKNDE